MRASALVIFSVWSVIVCTCIAANCKLSNDYCALCADHVACKPLPSDCPKYTQVKSIEFDENLIKAILFTTNDLRNSVANGSRSDRGLPAAARMATVGWSCELAYLAAKNVDQCKMQHDSCLKIDGNAGIGQNLAMMGHSSKFYDLKELAEKSVQMWYDEIKDVTQKDVDKLEGGPKFPKIGHFVQLMQQKVKRIGCAAKQYFDGKFYWGLVACNYDSPNWLGAPVYEPSSQPGSQCKSGLDSTFRALCSANEVY